MPAAWYIEPHMDGPLLGDSAFAIDALWQPSSFHQDGKDTSLFEPFDLKLPPLDLEFEGPQGLGVGFIGLETLDSGDAGAVEGNPLNIEPLPDPSPTSQASSASELALPNVWTLDLDAGRENAPQLRTWEAFEKKDGANDGRAMYLSEAGPSAFDAVLARHDSPSQNVGVLPQEVIIRAVCNLVLGRSSIFFQWDHSKDRFIQTLDDVPMSGLSLTCSQSYISGLMDLGTSFRRLRDLSGSSTKRSKAFPAAIAFKAALADVLDRVERNVSDQLQRARSLLRVQYIAAKPAQLLILLERISKVATNATSDEEAISTLSDQVHSLAEANNQFTPVIHHLLVLVSVPWLEQVKKDIGLGDYLIASPEPIADPSAGNTLVSEPDTSFKISKDPLAPPFVEAEDWSLVMEMKSSLKILRTHLSNATGQLANRSPHSHGLGGPRNVPLVDPVRRPPAAEQRVPLEQSDLEGLVWAGDEEQRLYFEALEDHLSRAPAGQFDGHRAAQLWATVDFALSTSDAHSLETQADLQLIRGGPLSVLTSVLPSQSRLINNRLMRYLFQDCKLRHHIELQHSFHLFSNGDFVARLCSALFGSEMQSAERKRGNIPTSEAMGLRLSTRRAQQWPPASSELQLTLMGILSESYHSDHKTSSAKRIEENELPGGLSFSIRELSDAEIDRVLEVQSLYALDFLRLQYTPPAPLNAILTACAMQQYDGIFRFSLKVMRVVYLTTQLKAASCRRPASRASQDKKSETVGGASHFALKAHHVASSLMSMFLGEGISVPWHSFAASLADIERSVSSGSREGAEPNTGVNVGINGLRDLHGACLDRIRTRLFLKRKQEKLRCAVADVLAAILKVASILGESSSPAGESLRTALRQYDEGCQRLVEVLVEHSRKMSKPSSGHGAPSAGGEEAEAAGLLLMRLNWNQYYFSDEL